MHQSILDELSKRYTYDYQQPGEYHFSLDSIHLAAYVSTQLNQRQNLNGLRVLDLCAGCGVIGIELSWHVRELRQIDFIEIQDCYTEFFYHNIRNVNRPEVQFGWYCLNYDALIEPAWTEKYDLIVSNPPYFLPHHGILSPSEFKNRCRFYLDSSFANYIRAIENALADQGQAYCLIRPLHHHGIDLLAAIQELLSQSPVKAEKVSQTRGVDIILFEK